MGADHAIDRGVQRGGEADARAQMLAIVISISAAAPLYAGFVNARARQTGRLFQGRFGSVAMDEDHLMAAARTVALNPQPIGIVKPEGS